MIVYLMCVKVFTEKCDVLSGLRCCADMTEGRECLFFFSTKTEGHIFKAAATHLAHIHLVSVFACSGAICGKDGCSVAIGVSVDQTDGVIQSLCLQNNQHRPEDLLSVALHLRLREHRRVAVQFSNCS